MNTRQRIILIGGFLMLTLVAVFPARKHFGGNAPLPREFLFSGSVEVHSCYQKDSHSGKEIKVGAPAKIDFGRLFAESLCMAAVTGLLFVLMGKRKNPVQ